MAGADKQELPDQIKRLQSHFLGQRYAGATLSAVNLRRGHAQTVADWAKKKSGMMILAGIPGCGKTYLCSALISWMYGKVSDIYALKEADFFERIRNSMDMKGDYRGEIEFQIDHEFLIYDDMGSTGQGSATGWRQEVLFELINLRYESLRPTVITTNFSRKEVAEKLGARSYSRLYAQENTLIEMFDYPDLRQPEWMQKPTTT